jgi:dual specificity phosphatase 3
MGQEEMSRQIGVANAHFVTDRLAVGGDLDYDDALALRQAVDLVVVGRISHILDVRIEASDELFWAHARGVTYCWDGIDDAGQRVPVAWFDRIVSWALAALEDPDARLLAHCHMGVNRGPSAGYAVLLGLDWGPVDALAAIRAARPIANVWYAEDALRWHHWRTGASAEARRHDLERVAAWRREHPLDVVRVIREQREYDAIRPQLVWNALERERPAGDAANGRLLGE